MSQRLVLRDDQSNAKRLLADGIRAGHKKIMLYGPCSFGKTFLAANLFEGAVAKGKKCLFICDRKKLIDQALAEFEGYGLKCGVIQSLHPRTDYNAPVQIASIQTLERRTRMLDFDFCIIDEAHSLRKSVVKMMEAFNNLIFIGMSATPYSKGLGKHYTHLIVPTTPRKLLEKELLCPVRYFAGVIPDLSSVPTVTIPTGGRDYNPNKAEIVMTDPKLIGDTVAEWKVHAIGLCTIAFSISRAASRALVDAFNAEGIPAVHIDAYTSDEDRVEIFQQHHDGIIKILSCCTLLDTGYNEKKVAALIDCSPTKSLIRYVQKGGRIQRILQGKEYAVYLDHAGNVDRFGLLVEDVVPTELHDGEKKYRENELAKKPTEAQEPKKCKKCNETMIGLKCLKCGTELQGKREEIETIAGSLKEVKQLRQDKMIFLEGLLTVGQDRGYANAQGWAKHKYKEKYGDWPSFPHVQPGAVTKEVSGFLTHLAIKNKFSKKPKKSAPKTGQAAINKIMGAL
tara:strand:+ start:23600 stop:25129 length:1530 start_codon:yes stop_codon:yes gene_type:complete